ncbi:MAG: YeeE/YedE family protein [Caldilineaceae bacterium]|nr:YeeE/YedE family protein [Caldilineaceae bacterium]
METRRSFAVRSGRQLATLNVSPLTMGAVAALLAVAAGAFFALYPPETYGLCMACHARDLVNWSLNQVVGTQLLVAEASAIFPVLTVVGVLAGALVAAVASGEFHWRTMDNPIKTFVYGVLVMNFALLAAGCSFRLALRAAAGEPLGLAGFGAFVAGVVGATWWLKREALR